MTRKSRLPTRPGQRNALGAPVTNLGWAEHYALKHIKDPSNTQAEHLSWLHLLFHETRDIPKEEARIAQEQAIQAEIKKCLSDAHHLRETITVNMTLKNFLPIPNKTQQQHATV